MSLKGFFLPKSVVEVSYGSFVCSCDSPVIFKTNNPIKAHLT